MSTIGLMEGAFFVGRKEIVDWINSTLDLNISKVEETASGAVACQLLDIMYPGQVPMHKLNWAAKQDFEFVANYKILQTAFSKLGIERHVDVDRLITARYMDNLEFMQWFKRFFEMQVHDKGDYDAYAQRCKGKGGAQFNNGGKKSAVKSSVPAHAPVRKAPAVSAPTKSSNQENNTPSNINSQGHTTLASRSKEGKEAGPSTAHHTSTVAPPPAPSVTTAANSSFATNLLATELENANKEIANLRNALEESRKSYSDLKVDYEGLEKERDFYYEKLRDIEVLLQEIEDKGQSNDLTASIFKILYATADGFDNNANDTEQPILHTLTADSEDGVVDVTNKDLNTVLDLNPPAPSNQILLESGNVTTSEETY
mmetsp:Transcript_31469/g.34394  ORF Transcript_31469/g.34394 Transcript_31469/m.34394 type:complete len:371 (-) Transcript_31469:75-1187(-)|eukprot:CAMPEP_0173148734 /NCGR_PEP_ID=MMETSP1105-20130129/9896_1 /TAXON_ID=2985 /ORGANISM="Ochromonas sp., Strain BG-1" /LENGTH=370 /DNA_ID=CAMNT_0014063445 /DNA_START=89 /DNA_END=1201 /DNA_ORIENTATION=-